MSKEQRSNWKLGLPFGELAATIKDPVADVVAA